MTSTTSIKLTMGHDMRKIQLPSLEFALLEQAVTEAYGTGPFHIAYEDEEGDEVSVSSSSELREAIMYAGELKRSVKLSVVEQPVVIDHAQHPLSASALQFDKTRLASSESEMTNVAGTQVSSKRRGAAFTLTTPKASARTLQLEALSDFDHKQLRKTDTKVTHLADMVTGTQIFSDRRGEVFSFKVPKNSDSVKQLEAIRTFGKQQLRPTQTKVMQVADMLAGTQVYSERRGKSFSFRLPRGTNNPKPTRVKQLEGITDTRKQLRPTKTKLVHVADMMTGTQVYSARQGKAFTFSVPKAQVSKRQSNNASELPHINDTLMHINDTIKAFPREDLRPATTDVKQLCDVMAGKRIYSQRRGRVFCFTSPVPQKRSQNQKLKKRRQKHSLRIMEQALSHQKRKLRHTSTSVKQICDVVAGMPVFSGRRGRVFFFKSPVLQRFPSSSSTLPCSLLSELCGFECHALRRTVPRVRYVSDVYAGCKVFSKRRGRTFSYRRPVPQPQLTTSISTPLRNKDSELLARLSCGKKKHKLQPVTTRVTQLSDKFKGQEVWSQRRGRVFQYKRPKPQLDVADTQHTQQPRQHTGADTLTSLGLGNARLNQLLLAHFQGDLQKAAQALLLMARAKKDTNTNSTFAANC